MADSAPGLERSIDPNGYSPITSGNRGSADRSPRPAFLPIDAHDSDQAKIATLIQLAKQNLETGNDAEAEGLFRKAFEIGDRVLGPDDPQLNFLLNDLTRLYLRQSAYASAEPLLLRLLEMKRSKGDDHPEVATVLASLASVRQSLGHHESAEQLWRRVLDIRERTLAPNHFAIATALERLGDACAARGKTQEALAAFQRALIIRERTLGGEHPSVRVSRERIADLELQASEDSIEPTTADAVHGRERFRLLSGESIAVTAPAPVPAPFEKIQVPHSRTATAVMGLPLADPAENDEVPDASADLPLNAAPSRVPGTTSGALPYRDALESIREELERPYETRTVGDRGSAILQSVFAFLGKKQVAAGGAVVVVALLTIAVATGAHAWGEVDQTGASQTPGLESSQLANRSPASSPAAIGGETTLPAIGSAGASQVTAQRSHVVEDRASAKKVVEKKPEGKAIAIPTMKKGVFASLDSVASRTVTSTSHDDDVYSIQPAQMPVGNGRSSFEDPEQSTGPVRARLIGDLPIPRVPSQVTDVEGEVRVQFNVDADGVPVMSTVSVLRSPHPLLTNAVTRVIPGMRFEPARGGPDRKPVADVVQIGFQFARARE